MGKYINTRTEKAELTPFKRCCLENFPFIEADFDALTNYELYCKIVEYLNMVIDQVNVNTTNTQEFINKFNELKTYVDNYFANLDVQEEINNKLDQMATDGTLTDIIAQYLKLAGVLAYDTVTEMKTADNLENGSIALVLGNLNLNDGFGGFYKVSNLGTEDGLYTILLNNGLYATLMNDLDSNFYEEISYTINRKDNTDYYLTTIPKFDRDNNQIDLYVGEAVDNHDDRVTDRSPNGYARKNLTSFTCNATLAIKDTDGLFYDSIVISNGKVINPAHTFENRLSDDYRYVCIDKDRNFTSYQANITDSSTMLAAGVQQAFICFYQLIENGKFIDHDNEISNLKDDIRQIIGVKDDGTVIIFTNDGRSSASYGFTDKQCADILLEQGVINAWELDGGGSASTNVKTIKINRNVDINMTKDRNIKYTLNAKKTIVNKSLAETYKEISNVKNELNKNLMNYINSINNVCSFNINKYNFEVTGYNNFRLSSSQSYSVNHLSLNDDFSININKKGIYVFIGVVEVTTNDGFDFIEMFKNDLKISIQKYRTYDGIVNTPFILIDEFNVNDKLYFKYDGRIGEAFNRGKIIAIYFGN